MPRVINLVKNVLLKNPILVLWQLTGRCNFKCQICRIWKNGHRVEEELNFEQIDIVTKKLNLYSPMLITLAGGEPLLREDLPEIMKIVSQKHYTNIITNGYLMTRKLAKDLYKNGMRDAMVSLDYSTPNLHDTQRGHEGAFKNAINALEFLRDERPSVKNKVRILTVLLDNNIEEIEGLLLIAKELSVSLSLTLYSNHLGKLENYHPTKEVSEYLLELKKRHKNFESPTQYLKEFDVAVKSGVKACGGGKMFININQQGMISRCIDRYDSPIANPFIYSSKEIFQLLKKENAAVPCHKCWTSCRGLAENLTGFKGIKSYYEFFKASRPYKE